MTQVNAVKLTGAVLATIGLTILNALAMLSWMFSNPALVSPFVSGGILALVAAFVIRWFRSGEPPNITLSLLLSIAFAPILFAVFCHPLAAVLNVVDYSLRLDWIFEVLRLLFIPIFGFLVWIITAGPFYLAVAGVLVILSWKRAYTPAQKGWIALCGLTVAGGLLYNLWWYGTGQQITWP